MAFAARRRGVADYLLWTAVAVLLVVWLVFLVQILHMIPNKVLMSRL